MHFGNVGGGRQTVMATPRPGADRRADKDVTGARQPSPLARREHLAGHRRDSPVGKVAQVPAIGVPGDDGGRVQQVLRAGGPCQKLVEPPGVIAGRPQDHQMCVGHFRVVPGQPAGMQTAVPQRAHQPGIVAVTCGMSRATGQYDARMEGVRAG